MNIPKSADNVPEDAKNNQVNDGQINKRIYFEYDDDIIDPCQDNVFKATFTKETPESRGALKRLLSAIIGRDLDILAITANEPPVDSINERQIRYDVNCRFDNGDLCNIEMTLYPDAFEPVRLEYYSGKLFTGQDIRGQDKSYNDLKDTYQISLLVKNPVFKDDEFVHHFRYYDREREMSLSGKTNIITLELAKLEQTLQKTAADMTPPERWAVFFRYTTDIEKRALVNEIIRMEEGIAMAGEVLLTISKDDVERARLMSEYKYEVDLQSKIVEAGRAGKVEGKAEGRVEERVEIAKNMKRRGRPIEEIVEDTGLTREEVEELSAE